MRAVVWVDHMARHAEGVMRGFRLLAGGRTMAYEVVATRDRPPGLGYPEPAGPRSKEAKLRSLGWAFVPVPDRHAGAAETEPLHWALAEWLAIPPEGMNLAARKFRSRHAALAWAQQRASLRA